MKTRKKKKYVMCAHKENFSETKLNEKKKKEKKQKIITLNKWKPTALHPTTAHQDHNHDAIIEEPQ